MFVLSKKYYKYFVMFIILLLLISFITVYFLFYNNISTISVRKDFNKDFNYYLTGNCDKYAASYNVSFSNKFLNQYGDTDWVRDATFEKKWGIAERCRADRSILDVKIKNISREKFSNTAFILAEMVKVNKNGIHHTYPESFVMKNFDDGWKINIYCNTAKDPECK